MNDIKAALEAIKQDYPTKLEGNFLLIVNPKFKEDNGENPFITINLVDVLSSTNTKVSQLIARAIDALEDPYKGSLEDADESVHEALVALYQIYNILNKNPNHDGVHKAHCYQGEYHDSCKYGDYDCPAAKPRASNPKECPACKGEPESGFIEMDNNGPIVPCWKCNTHHEE